MNTRIPGPRFNQVPPPSASLSTRSLRSSQLARHVARLFAPRRARGPIAVVALGAGFALALVLGGAWAGPSGPWGPGALDAHGGLDVDVVVDFGDGRVEVAHLDAISGTTALDALYATGLEVVTHHAGFGLAVCSVGGVGCPADDCFCACQGEDCRFWGFQHGDGAGGWTSAAEGAGDFLLPEAGSVQGFVWGRPAPMAWTPERLGAMNAWTWLRGQIQPDGGLFDPGLTLDGLLAARAVQADPAGWRAGDGGPSAVDNVRAAAGSYPAIGAAQAGKYLAGLAALDQGRVTPEELASARAQTLRTVDLGSGRFGASVWDQSWAMIGLAASDLPIGVTWIAALEAEAAASGGWGDLPGAESASPDATGLALAALGAAGASESPAVAPALAWLTATRHANGGWGGDGSGDTPAGNVNSSALVVTGLLAVGEDPRATPWTVDGVGPLTYLASTQEAEGFLLHTPDASELLATLQAIPAMSGRSPLLRGAAVSSARAVQAALDERQMSGAFAAGFIEGGPAATIDALLALHAAGVDPEEALEQGALSVTAWLIAEGPAYALSGAEGAGRVAAAAVALGLDPANVGGADIAATLAGHLDAVTGLFGDGATASQAWAMIGWSALGRDVPDTVIDALMALAGDGGWSIGAGAPVADADSTALALEALVAAGLSADDVRVRGVVAALGGFQDASGGFRGLFGIASADTTARAIVALSAAGQHVDAPGWARSRDGLRWTTPREALTAMQLPNGHFPGLGDQPDPSATYVALRGLVTRAEYVAPEASGGRVYLPLLVRPR